jgi:hypothetical protein
MTFADLLCEMIACEGDLAIQEARRVFDQHREDFPSANCLNIELNDQERLLLLDFYRGKQHTRQWITNILENYQQENRGGRQ